MGKPGSLKPSSAKTRRRAGTHGRRGMGMNRRLRELEGRAGPEYLEHTRWARRNGGACVVCGREPLEIRIPGSIGAASL